MERERERETWNTFDRVSKILSERIINYRQKSRRISRFYRIYWFSISTVKKKGKNGCKTWWKIQNARFFLFRFTFVNSPRIPLERSLKYYRKTLFYKIHLSKLKNDKIFEEIRLEEENFRRRGLTYIYIYKMARVSSRAPFLILRKRVEEVVWQIERGEGERGVIDLNGWSSYKF